MDRVNTETAATQSVLEAFPRDSGDCLNCGVRLPERKRRRGSARRCCSPRCRKLAWLSKTQSVPGKVGHVAHKRERLGRITDRAGAMAGCSGRAVRRSMELDRLVREMFGDDKADQLRQDIMAGTTAPVTTMLRAVKSQIAAQQEGIE